MKIKFKPVSFLIICFSLVILGNLLYAVDSNLKSFIIFLVAILLGLVGGIEKEIVNGNKN